MAKTLGRSTTRHNLSSITLKKLHKPQSILNTPVQYTGTCKECGAECASTVDLCLSCAIG